MFILFCLYFWVAGIIEKLISKGNHIIAVKFIYEFEMTKQFPPVPLLEEYAMESKSVVHKIRMSGDVNSHKMVTSHYIDFFTCN